MKQAQLNEKDHQFAKEYLERKLTLSPNWLSEGIDTQFEAIKAFETKNRDKVTLQKWCNKWLKVEQKKQLKNAIRAKRSREPGNVNVKGTRVDKVNGTHQN
jgi:macrodomain Ter protein organizer (MatP/YcbG family)